jgi:glycosyltransferase involved in cell wall biosynthesis
VQFRYYGQYLRQLRSRFKLVLLAPDNEVDEPVKALFDEIIPIKFSPKGDHLFQSVIAIKTAAPDIIFWPSIGMQHWGPLIANLRLAPIQMTSVGHPASTLIEAIDYMFLEEGFVLDAELFSEKAILLPDKALRLEHPRDYKPIAPEVRERADVVRIALASNLMKLNPSFVGVLKSIRERASRPIEYHVFGSATPLRLAAFRTAHAETLGRDVFHQRLSPNEYLQRLNACDMALSPFPFGGFHSVIDCLRQGLPVVAMDQPGHPFRTDWMLMRLLDMPEWLVVNDPEQYIQAALRVIEDDALRVSLSRQAIDAEIDDRLFGDASTPLGSEVVETMWALYLAHDAVKASPKKAFRLQDLRQLASSS